MMGGNGPHESPIQYSSNWVVVVEIINGLSNDTHHDMRRIHSTINNSSSLQDVGGATSNVHHQIT